MIKSLNQQSSPYAAHEQASMLIPWFVNGSLDEDELSLVQSHLDVCLSCRRELAEHERLYTAIRSVDAQRSSVQRSFTKLVGQIRQPVQPRASGLNAWLNNLVEQCAELLSLPVTRYAMSGAVVATLIFALPGSNELNSGRGDHLYRTLSASKPEASVAGPGDILVAFRRGTSPDVLKQVVAASGGTFVGGPDHLGIYTLRLNDSAALSDVIEGLRRSTVVVLAEPALPVGGASPRGVAR